MKGNEFVRKVKALGKPRRYRALPNALATRQSQTQELASVAESNRNAIICRADQALAGCLRILP